MAQKLEVQYIQYYTGGSAAYQLDEAKPRRKKSILPKLPVLKPRVIHVDPLAVAGIVVSSVMLVLMAVGCAQLYEARQQVLQMEDYVLTLQEENAVLIETYETGYDLATVKESALALGMIPVQEANTVTISVEKPQVEQPLTGWQRVCAFLEGLFA